MSDIYIGIDPGKKGAIGMIQENKIEICDMPLLPNGEVDGLAIFNMLPMTGTHNIICALEKAQSMSKQGVKGVFTYGMGYGTIKAALCISKIPYIEVHPTKWKKYFSLTKEKKQSITLAMKLFPDVQLHTPRGRMLDGRAEALLLAHYVKQGQV